MRAYEIHEFGVDNLVEVECDVPEIGERDVLVRIRAVSLNFRDLMVISGTYNPKMRLPAIPFSDAAGEVVAVGDEVSRFSVGDRVCSLVVSGWIAGGPTAETSKTAIGAGRYAGVLREYAAFDEAALVPAPTHLSFAEAATLPCAAVTAWNALMVAGKLKTGETVLTLGSGGVSLFALQFAKLAGARVISTSSSDEKLTRLRALGADESINYRETEDWSSRVAELTDGRGVDHVVEVGGIGTLAQSIASVRVGGHIALIGALASEGKVNPVTIFMKAIRMNGIFVGSREMFEAMNTRIAEPGMRPLIDKTFALKEVRNALRYMAEGKHFGKIVVTV
ncbi:MAG: NAD(P)-dependent alcohol dehydrogenase [Blastocatellia bacterium]|nr:NAD(P)-dependent alcohol dehydrogenase [Blastocatellia bacterium]